jgi:acetyl esterase
MPVDAQVQAVLDAVADSARTPITDVTPNELRELFTTTAAMAGRPDTEAGTEDVTAEGPDGPVTVRVYRPAARAPLPLVVFFHGGGWVIGDVASYDPFCHHLAVLTPAVVVSVEYRLAPEHPFPAGLSDCEAAVRWAAAHAAELGTNGRLAVAGDSAGGNLAAVVARRARDAGGPPISFQLLCYPVTDATGSSPSVAENAEGYLLTRADMEWFCRHYLQGADPKDPDVSPLFADDLSDLPPARVVTAEYDPLRDEGEAYAARLAEAGVPATVVRYDGMIHGFLSMGGVVDTGRRALGELAAVLADALAVSR